MALNGAIAHTKKLQVRIALNGASSHTLVIALRMEIFSSS